MKIPKNIQRIIDEKSGINLDIGGGANPNKGFINLDILDLPEVDIVWDFNRTPWPLPDECVLKAVASHVLEHILPTYETARLEPLVQLLIKKGILSQKEADEELGKPSRGFLGFMDELWRVMKPGGQFAFVVPYAGNELYNQDPTHCLIDGAEVLTKDGFKDIKDIKVGEDILTFNMETDAVEYSSCQRLINEPYEGDVVRFKNRAMDIAVTPNHDLMWKTYQPNSKWSKKPAEDFFNKVGFGRYGLATIPNWEGKSPENISISSAENNKILFDAGDFMELLGWVISEGGFRIGIKPTHNSYVNIYQLKTANPEKYSRITILLTRMGIEFKEYYNHISIRSIDLFHHLSPLGTQDVRYIPIEYKELSIPLLLRLLESLRLGDGDKHNAYDSSGGYNYSTISYKLASDVNEVALKCGFRSHIYIVKGKEFLAPNGKTYTRKDQYRVSICPLGENMVYPKPQIEYYEGNIVCVQVEKNHTILTRYNGHVAWVGNCNPINGQTVFYFDPDPEQKYAGLALYLFYQPRPWKIEFMAYHTNGLLECILSKRLDDPSYHDKRPEDITQEFKNVPKHILR